MGGMGGKENYIYVPLYSGQRVLETPEGRLRRYRQSIGAKYQ